MKKLIILFCIGGVILSGYLFAPSKKEIVAMLYGAAATANKVVSGPSNLSNQNIPMPLLEQIDQSANDNEFESFINGMILLMKSELSGTIEQVSVQAGLKEFKDDLVKQFAAQGPQIFERIVRGAFPELADKILKIVALMDQYGQWLLDTAIELNRLSIEEQQGILWEKRYALFNDDAPKIWSQQLTPEEEQQQIVQNTMLMLHQSYDMPMEERIDVLQQTFAEHYDSTSNAIAMMADPTSIMTQVFFQLDSVQKELENLPKAKRQAQINEIRRKFGFSEEAIEALEQRDQKEEEVWNNGYAYMEERNELVAKNLSDSSFQKELASLRSEYFGDAAYTIKKEEEEMQYFRYRDDRMYGWN